MPPTLLVILAVGLTACGSSDSDKQAAPSPQPAATRISIPRYQATASQLSRLRRQWSTATLLALQSGDSVHGQILELLDDHDRPRDGFALQTAPDAGEARRALPARWSMVGDRLGEAVDVIRASRDDLKKWMDGADLDDDLTSTLHDDSGRIVSAMCDALGSAREYYAAAGGYRNDLTFTLISDKGDPPCANVPMRHPYATTMRKRELVTIAETTNEHPEDNNEDAFLGDHTGFVLPAGAEVKVTAYRFEDDIDATMCRVHGAGGTGWVPCSDVTRRPRTSDG